MDASSLEYCQNRLIDMCAHNAEACAQLGNLASGYEAWQERGLQVIDGVVDQYFAIYLNRYVDDRSWGVAATDPEGVFLRYCADLAKAAFARTNERISSTK